MGQSPCDEQSEDNRRKQSRKISQPAWTKMKINGMVSDTITYITGTTPSGLCTVINDNQNLRPVLYVDSRWSDCAHRSKRASPTWAFIRQERYWPLPRLQHRRNGSDQGTRPPDLQKHASQHDGWFRPRWVKSRDWDVPGIDVNDLFFADKMTKWLKFDKFRMNVMEALQLLNSLIDESDPDVDIPNIVHAFQTAERIRQVYPDDDWFHLTGLIHDLGKVRFRFFFLLQIKMGN